MLTCVSTKYVPGTYEGEKRMSDTLKLVADAMWVVENLGPLEELSALYC